MGPAEQYAYVQGTLAQARDLGYSRAALDLLLDAYNTCGDSRLMARYRTLYEGQYRPSRVVQTLNDGSYWTWTNVLNDDGTFMQQTRVYTDANGEEIPFMTARTDEAYDRGGVLLESTQYIGEGPDVFAVSRQEYDAHGNPTLYIETNNGSVVSILEFTYDEHDNELTMHRSDYDEGVYEIYGGTDEELKYARNSSYTCENEYDEAGLLVKVTKRDESGAITKVEEREYDGYGFLVKIVSYDGDGNVTGHTDYTRDENGRLVTRYVYGAEENIKSGEEIERDADGRIVKHTYYTTNGDVREWDEISYNADGLELTHAQHYPDETMDFTMEYEYAFFPYN